MSIPAQMSSNDPVANVLGEVIIGARDYFDEVTRVDRKNIRFIITNLADTGLLKLWAMQSDVEGAGERVRHLHPLKFLECIFTDEELKVGIHTMTKRTTLGQDQIWREFVRGVSESLNQELKFNNLSNDLLVHFAQSVEIDHTLIAADYNKRNWTAMIETLVNHIPRKGDFNRYDI